MRGKRLERVEALGLDIINEAQAAVLACLEGHMEELQEVANSAVEKRNAQAKTNGVRFDIHFQVNVSVNATYHDLKKARKRLN